MARNPVAPAGAEKAGTAANVVAALNGVACLKPLILEYGRVQQVRDHREAYVDGSSVCSGGMCWPHHGEL